MAGLADFIAELKRRRVFRVAVIYAVVAWALIQVAATVQPFLGMPAWTVTLVIVLLAIGLPVALVLGWAFDLTPDGVQRAPAGDGVVEPRFNKFVVVPLVLVALLGGAWLAYARPGMGADAKSIAVLPFTNLSTDAANEYFADGIHEQILTQLTQIADLHVISRTSVMQYKQQQRNLREIAQALGVGTVLEGSVQREGKRVRIHAQLIDAKRDKHLWSESYDRDVTDVFAIQSSIAQEISDALRAHLTPDEQAALSKPPTQNTEAYDIYLRARQDRGSSAADARKRIELYGAALQRDSSFVLAQIGLAESLFDLVDSHFEMGRLPELESAVSRALRIAPDAAESHLLLARLKSRNLDEDGTLAETAIARELKPNDPRVLGRYANAISTRGLFAEAAVLYERVLTLDPASVGTRLWLANSLAGLERWAEAEQQLERSIALSPTDPSLFALLIQLRAAHADRMEDVRQLIDENSARYDPAALAVQTLRGSGNIAALLLELKPDFYDALTLASGVDSVDYYLVNGYVLQRKGRLAEARASFESDRRVGEQRVRARFGESDSRFQNLTYLTWGRSDLALALAALGRFEEAITHAEQAVEHTPPSTPAQAGVHLAWILARVYVSAGRYDDAIAVLERTLAVPLAPVAGLTPARLRIDPVFAPLRGRLAFDRLANPK